jgi:hypothetical protein
MWKETRWARLIPPDYEMMISWVGAAKAHPAHFGILRSKQTPTLLEVSQISLIAQLNFAQAIANHVIPLQGHGVINMTMVTRMRIPRRTSRTSIYMLWSRFLRHASVFGKKGLAREVMLTSRRAA